MRRRGRRAAGAADARGAIVAAARSQFAALGYDRATMRGIARRAGVDARLVNHYFRSKEELYAEAVLALVTTTRNPGLLTGGPLEELGPRLVRGLFDAWDQPAERDVVLALLRALTIPAEDAQGLTRRIGAGLLARVVDRTVAPDRQDLRASLVVAQLVGLGLLRYVLEAEPVASAGVEDLEPLLGPCLQWYLVGDVPPAVIALDGEVSAPDGTPAG